MLLHARSQVARAISSHQPAAGRDTTLADRGSLRSQRAVLYRIDRLMTAHCSRVVPAPTGEGTPRVFVTPGARPLFASFPTSLTSGRRVTARESSPTPL